MSHDGVVKPITEEQIAADVSAIREKLFSEWMAQEERKIRAGGGSYEAMSAGIDGYLSKVAGGTQAEIRLRERLTEATP